MQVWLDLEGTIINNWNQGMIFEPDRIKHWLDVHEIKEINIWSFAIHDKADKNFFATSDMRKNIEQVLGCSIINFPSVDEMQKYVYVYEHIRYEDRDHFMQMNGKHWSFIKYCMQYQQKQTSILIDDTVPSLNVNDRKTQSRVQLINVNNI